MGRSGQSFGSQRLICLSPPRYFEHPECDVTQNDWFLPIWNMSLCSISVPVCLHLISLALQIKRFGLQNSHFTILLACGSFDIGFLNEALNKRYVIYFLALCLYNSFSFNSQGATKSQQ